MEASSLALVQGIDATRATLREWNAAPRPVLGRWLLGAFAIVVVLLLTVVVIASLVTPDPTGLRFAGLNKPADVGDAFHTLYRNSLVLALHAMACVAGFIAGSSLPTEADRYSGLWRRVHERAGPLAIAFVVAATTFSLVTQAYVLGGGASTLSAQLGISPVLLIVGLLPHALPELLALFLPLAAWVIASRRGDWHQLLAATFVTVAIAVPVLVATAFIEIWVSPHLLVWLAS